MNTNNTPYTIMHGYIETDPDLATAPPRLGFATMLWPIDRKLTACQNIAAAHEALAAFEVEEDAVVFVWPTDDLAYASHLTVKALRARDRRRGIGVRRPVYNTERQRYEAR